MKIILAAMALVLMVFSPALAWDGLSYEDGLNDGRRQGDPFVSRELKKNREYQQKKDEKADRDAKARKEEQETRAQDARRESAYRESKAAHRKKVNKMRKKAGFKPHNSWQLNH
jgi:hypothetical protein